MTTRAPRTVCVGCGMFNCDCEELQEYAKAATWDRFKQEVEILKIKGFGYQQLMDYIRMKYGRI